MKNLLCFWSLCVASLTVVAQPNVFFRLSPSLAINSIHKHELNEYVRTYNEQQYLPPYFKLMSPYTRNYASAGLEADLCLTLLKEEQDWGFFYNTGFLFQKGGQKNEAAGIIDYAADLKFSDVYWLNDLGMHRKRKLYLGLSLSLCQRTTALESYYVYPDGSEDFGLQESFLGYFSNRSLDLKTGPYVGYRIGRFVQIQSRLFLPLSINQKADAAKGLVDEGRRNPSEHAFPQSFPLTTDASKPVHLTSFYGPSFQLAVGVNIGAGKGAKSSKHILTLLFMA